MCVFIYCVTYVLACTARLTFVVSHILVSLHMWNMYARTHNKTRGARRGTQSIVSRSFRFIHAAAGHMQPVAAHIHMPVAISDLPFFARACRRAARVRVSALQVQLCALASGPSCRTLSALPGPVRSGVGGLRVGRSGCVRADSHTHGVGRSRRQSHTRHPLIKPPGK